MRTALVATMLVTTTAIGRAQERPTVVGGTLRPAAFEDYRTPVGRVENGVLRITLDAGEAAWQPWGPNGPTVRANVFAADGAPPRVPGPLIRVIAGTPVHITLRNGLADSIVVRGCATVAPRRHRSGSAPS
jgi:FtsP/CotA-like multicopper oxidase with cupredoxin domain